jgi:hypothetical protein
VRDKWRLLKPTMDERAQRLWAGAEAGAIGYGGVAAVARATKLAISTVRKGRNGKTRERRHLLVDVGMGPADVVRSLGHAPRTGLACVSVQNGGQGTRNMVRTVCLWGVRLRPRLMHDGQNVSRTDSILRHSNQSPTRPCVDAYQIDGSDAQLHRDLSDAMRVRRSLSYHYAPFWVIKITLNFLPGCNVLRVAP